MILMVGPQRNAKKAGDMGVEKVHGGFRRG